ncbi:hypothetical protein D9M73_269530 [compost metagenome]
MKAVGQVQAKKHQAFGTSDAVTGIEHWQAQDSNAEHYRQIERQRVRRDRQGFRGDQCGQAQYGQQVEQVAADHRAHGDLPFATQGGDQRSGQFRHGGADGDDRQADNTLGQAQVGGHLDGSFQ